MWNELGAMNFEELKQDHYYDFREGKQGPPPLAPSNEREGNLGPLDRAKNNDRRIERRKHKKENGTEKYYLGVQR